MIYLFALLAVADPGEITVPDIAVVPSESVIVEGPQPVSISVQRNIDQLKYCYEHALKTDADLALKGMTMEMRIEHGRAMSVEVFSSPYVPKDHPFKKCLLEKVRKWRFGEDQSYPKASWPVFGRWQPTEEERAQQRALDAAN